MLGGQGSALAVPCNLDGTTDIAILTQPLPATAAQNARAAPLGKHTAARTVVEVPYERASVLRRWYALTA